MRFIDTSSIKVPTNWVDLAKKKFGSSYTSLWSFFKDDFEDLVGKKCWYSESVNIGSANPIDHYRPKAAKVQKLPDYSQIKSIIDKINTNSGSGYSFLEYEFTNYRYSCQFVNSLNVSKQNETSRGKSNYFPISISSVRSTSLANLANEEYCLLDPCNREDVQLLTFNNLGLVEPSSTILPTTWEYCKVLVSIEVYHLHYCMFVEARLRIWNKCEGDIRRADYLYSKHPKDEEEIELFKGYINDILKGIEKNEQFSATVIDCIKHNKQKYLWLDKIVTEERLEK